jgi:hypothetical protein
MGVRHRQFDDALVVQAMGFEVDSEDGQRHCVKLFGEELGVRWEVWGFAIFERGVEIGGGARPVAEVVEEGG